MRYKLLEDGTRVYSNGHKYRPVAVEDRKYAVNKPDSPTAFRVGGVWYEPKEFLPDESREMPVTTWSRGGYKRRQPGNSAGQRQARRERAALREAGLSDA